MINDEYKEFHPNANKEETKKPSILLVSTPKQRRPTMNYLVTTTHSSLQSNVRSAHKDTLSYTWSTPYATKALAQAAADKVTKIPGTALDVTVTKGQ